MRHSVLPVLAASLIAVALFGVGHAQAPMNDIRHFRDHDLGRWRGGHWFNGVHGGRSGWWWVIGSQWYFYPAPVYPVPDPYLPGGVARPPGAPQWYYCASPPGYYPYIAECPMPWRVVPAQ